MMRSLLVLVYISLLTRIDRLAVEAGHGFGSLPGSPHNISRDDRGLLKALLFATYSFNNQSNDAFLFRVCAIEKAQRQIIKGIRYIMEVQISRTICRKPDARKLKECDFQPEGQLHQRRAQFLFPASDQQIIQITADHMLTRKPCLLEEDRRKKERPTTGSFHSLGVARPVTSNKVKKTE